MNAVGFLQNAWSPVYAGRTWPREYWLRALWACRSGQRLKLIVDECPSVSIWFDNTTPIVGASPSSVLPADFDHMRRVLDEQRPRYVIAFGMQSRLAVEKLREVGVLGSSATLLLPHPSYRVLQNQLYKRAGKILQSGFEGTIDIKQHRPRRRAA